LLSDDGVSTSDFMWHYKIDVNDKLGREGESIYRVFKNRIEYSRADRVNGRHAAFYVIRSTARDFALRDSQGGTVEWAALSVALEQYSNERVPF
jgi:hypothetical protein